MYQGNLQADGSIDDTPRKQGERLGKPPKEREAIRATQVSIPQQMKTLVQLSIS